MARAGLNQRCDVENLPTTTKDVFIKICLFYRSGNAYFMSACPITVKDELAEGKCRTESYDFGDHVHAEIEKSSRFSAKRLNELKDKIRYMPAYHKAVEAALAKKNLKLEI